MEPHVVTIEQLNTILKSHVRWLESQGQQGKRADLRMADLNGAQLEGADLRRANLTGALLQGGGDDAAARPRHRIGKIGILRATRRTRNSGSGLPLHIRLLR